MLRRALRRPRTNVEAALRKYAICALFERAYCFYYRLRCAQAVTRDEMMRCAARHVISPSLCCRARYFDAAMFTRRHGRLSRCRASERCCRALELRLRHCCADDSCHAHAPLRRVDSAMSFTRYFCFRCLYVDTRHSQTHDTTTQSALTRDNMLRVMLRGAIRATFSLPC